MVHGRVCRQGSNMFQSHPHAITIITGVVYMNWNGMKYAIAVNLWDERSSLFAEILSFIPSSTKLRGAAVLSWDIGRSAHPVGHES